MWRIDKQSGRIINIYKGQNEIDGFLIIPGVTTFTSITIKENALNFNNTQWMDSITIHFVTVADLERFLAGFTRESKIDAILNKDKK